MNNFEIGSYVWVKGQPNCPQMTLLKNDQGICECIWFDEKGNEHIKKYPKAILTPEEPKIIIKIPPNPLENLDT